MSLSIQSNANEDKAQTKAIDIWQNFKQGNAVYAIQYTIFVCIEKVTKSTNISYVYVLKAARHFHISWSRQPPFSFHPSFDGRFSISMMRRTNFKKFKFRLKILNAKYILKIIFGLHYSTLNIVQYCSHYRD